MLRFCFGWCAVMLPDGWTRWDEGVIEVIERPGFGCVSIDFSRREFAAGIVWRGRPLHATKYTGRCWRDRLIADAVKWLGAL